MNRCLLLALVLVASSCHLRETYRSRLVPREPVCFPREEAVARLHDALGHRGMKLRYWSEELPANVVAWWHAPRDLEIFRPTVVLEQLPDGGLFLTTWHYYPGWRPRPDADSIHARALFALYTTFVTIEQEWTPDGWRDVPDGD